jgi:FixJ family two-component response regulator
MTSPDTPTVFIVDDDGRMRAAMQRLLKTVGLHSESFASPQDFLRRESFQTLPAASYLMCDFPE